jgi:tripartite-type tricarboxylate transporter receptor subunit TctC
VESGIAGRSSIFRINLPSCSTQGAILVKEVHMLNHSAIAKAAAIGVFMMLASVLARPAHSQDYPRKPIRMIVAASPGGANDILGRMVARRMTESLGQAVIVDNRGGAGGALAAEFVARAPADGYTLLNSTNSVVVNPSLNPNASYTLKDLAPVTEFANFPLVITVHPSVPANTLQELVALAKKRGGLSYGSTGIGSLNHLTGVLLNNVAGVDNVHIPYKGAGPLMNALASGEVPIGISTVFSAAPYIHSGRLRAIAVTGSKPSPTLPGVPTVTSVYPGFDTNVWHGYFVPAGTPPAIIAILQREIVKALGSPEIRDALVKGGAEPVGDTQAEFAAVVAKDAALYGKLVKSSGAKAE